MYKLVLILLIIPIIGYSQHNITGKVLRQTGEAVKYAEIILQDFNSITVKSELTNENGEFQITDINL